MLDGVAHARGPQGLLAVHAPEHSKAKRAREREREGEKERGGLGPSSLADLSPVEGRKEGRERREKRRERERERGERERERERERRGRGMNSRRTPPATPTSRCKPNR